MGSSEPDAVVGIGVAAAEEGLRLSAEAGWNQTEADWRFLLTAGHGLGVRDADGCLIGSAVVLPYSRWAWVGMVLVTAAQRRRGIATALMRSALNLCDERGWIAGLDATAAGVAVYAPLGFRAIAGLTRWRAPEPRPAAIGRVPAMPTGDAERAAATDAAAFGAARPALLRHMAEVGRLSLGERTLVCMRPGRTAGHVGPVVAADEATAIALVDLALAARNGPALIDAFDDGSELAEALRRRGFAPERPFTRMLRGPAPQPVGPVRLYAAAGPEVG
jgi:GNAT superfamily N-acetyltransferase